VKRLELPLGRRRKECMSRREQARDERNGHLPFNIQELKKLAVAMRKERRKTKDLDAVDLRSMYPPNIADWHGNGKNSRKVLESSACYPPY